jgi:hypothetical protein
MNAIFAADDYAWLKRVLAKWVSRIERYSKRWANDPENEDVPYWHNEMATLSTFVAALGACNADVVSELSCIREDANVPDPKEAGAAARPRRGRVDLWFELPGKRSAYVEAKQVWPSSPTLLAGLTKRAFRTISHQVATFSGVRFGFVFVVPRVAEGGSFEDFVEALKAEVPKLVATASVFPPSARNLHGQRKGSKKYTFPGVILAIRDLTSPSAS